MLRLVGLTVLLPAASADADGYRGDVTGQPDAAGFAETALVR